jgi:hypothetical protein
MANVNDTQYTVIESTYHEGERKVPVALPNEGYFFNNGQLKMTVKDSSRRYATRLPGFVYLTDKRLVLIAKEATSDFDTFELLFDEILSLKTKFVSLPKVAAFVCHTFNGDTIEVELSFAQRAHCQTYQDYMKMIIVTAAAHNMVPPENGLMEATRLQCVDLPPSYSDVAAGVTDPILEENPMDSASPSHSAPAY